jgi:hypothetical protein
LIIKKLSNAKRSIINAKLLIIYAKALITDANQPIIADSR